MAIYHSFAQCYDLFMADTPYDEWVDFIEFMFKKYGKNPSLVLELACGTGSVTTRLAKRGYEMIGLDNSAEMLAVAAEKCKGVLYLCQDMREFELYGTVDCVLCMCDGLNYILDKKDLLKVFKLVKNYLNPGGLFIFDLNTQYKYEHLLDEGTFAQVECNAAYIWENYYDKKRRLNEYAVTFFVEDAADGLYKRFEETHSQRAHLEDEIRETAAGAGFNVLNIYDLDRPSVLEPPSGKTERTCFVLGV